jgi:hypothetical protein
MLMSFALFPFSPGQLFKKCSVNGRSYGDLMTERGELVDIDEETTPGLDFSWNHWHESNFRFYDPTLLEDTKRGLKEVSDQVGIKQWT